jgi:hypothetical protein
VSLNNLTYYKNSDNDWVFLGTDEWKNSWPTVQGTNSVSGALTVGLQLLINDQSVTVGQGGTALTVAGFATAISNAAIPGVTADSVSNKLTIYADSAATNDGSTDNGGVVSIEAGTGGAGLLTTLGITAGEYPGPPANLIQLPLDQYGKTSAVLAMA